MTILEGAVSTMGDHGASAFIPVNVIMMLACVALAASTLPWWMGIGVCLLMLVIWRFAHDQYGGMQICLLLLPGLLAGIMALGQHLSDARKSEGAVDWIPAIVSALVPIFLFPIVLFAIMAVTVAAVVGWEWLRGRIRNANRK